VPSDHERDGPCSGFGPKVQMRISWGMESGKSDSMILDDDRRYRSRV